MREPSRDPASWLASALQRNFDHLDKFLYAEELHPEQLAGLPDPKELMPDGPLAGAVPSKDRHARITHDPEKRARQILRREAVTSEDALEIFRRLPKEVSSQLRAEARRGFLFCRGFRARRSSSLMQFGFSRLCYVAFGLGLLSVRWLSART